MHRSTPHLAAAVIASMVLMPSFARGADPTNADCLAASEASLKAGNDHHLRAERAQLLVCSSSNCPVDIRKECLRRVDEVNAAIPTVIFQAKDSAGDDLLAVKVTMDGEVLAERLEGTPLSIDPGQHTFVFETSGQPPLQKQIVIQEGQKDQHQSITIGGASQQPASSQPGASQPGAPGVASEPFSSAPPPDETSGGLGPPKIAAIAAAGVGVVGLGLGGVFGLVALSNKNAAQKACPGQCADQAGVDKWGAAKTAAQISDVAFIVGGVGLGAAAVLWFAVKSPSANGTTAQMGVGPGSFELRGTW